jgi:predicted HAD superfamily Cof-like phosphohydrolase
MNMMHTKYGVHDAVNKLDESTLKSFVKFRAECVQEETTELKDAIASNDPEEIVDALIDVCVFAIGTLDLMGVDANKAWNSVLAANMNKSVGVKEGRPNPLGLPDLIKPSDWVGPNHGGNHGKF